MKPHSFDNGYKLCWNGSHPPKQCYMVQECQLVAPKNFFKKYPIDWYTTVCHRCRVWCVRDCWPATSYHTSGQCMFSKIVALTLPIFQHTVKPAYTCLPSVLQCLCRWTAQRICNTELDISNLCMHCRLLSRTYRCWIAGAINRGVISLQIYAWSCCKLNQTPWMVQSDFHLIGREEKKPTNQQP